MFSLPCIIFAGGKSSRMGDDKALLAFGGYDTLIEYQFARLSKLFKNVYISAKSKEKFPLHLQSYVIEDIEGEVFAPTAAFITIFKKLQEDKVFVLSVDAPFVGAKEIAKLIENDSAHYDAIIAKTPTYSHPLCGIYKHSLLDEFQKMLDKNTHKLNFLLKNSQTKYVEFPQEKAFFNLNTQQEYNEALQCYEK